jgi:hypothetical protein
LNTTIGDFGDFSTSPVTGWDFPMLIEEVVRLRTLTSDWFSCNAGSEADILLGRRFDEEAEDFRRLRSSGEVSLNLSSWLVATACSLKLSISLCRISSSFVLRGI